MGGKANFTFIRVLLFQFESIDNDIDRGIRRFDFECRRGVESAQDRTMASETRRNNDMNIYMTNRMIAPLHYVYYY